MEKQVTYFEAQVKNQNGQVVLEQHYVGSTAEFDQFVKVYKSVDSDADICYIAYNDGSVEDGSFLR